MTRAEIRATLTAFRDMVRARGPRECLEVAAMRVQALPQWLADSHVMCGDEWWREYDEWRFTQSMPRLAARAALRWWRWANRESRVVTVTGAVSGYEYWASDD